MTNADIFLVTVSFPLVDDPSTSLLAWTTTPWTLPSNLALCVHPDYLYIKIYDQERDQNFILHENLLGTLYKDPKKAKYKKVAQFLGSDMKGWRYIPLFEYFTEKVLFTPPCFLSSYLHWAGSTKIRPSELSPTPMSPLKTALGSFIKRLLSVTTIIVSR